MGIKKRNRMRNQESDKSLWWCGCDRELTSDVNVCRMCGQKRKHLNKKLKNANFDEKTELDLDD
jgi:hypothetical protein